MPRESPEFKGPEANIEQSSEREKGDPSKIEVFMTDHNLRHPEDVSLEQAKEVYREMREQGITSMRFDWDWDETFREPGNVDQATIDRYIAAMKAMKEVGLESPTLVLSSPPPGWALELYKEKPDAFFEACKTYAETAAETIRKSGLETKQVQILNEINHPFMYKFIKMEDIPRMAGIVRSAFESRGMDIALGTSIILGNEPAAIGSTLREPSLDQFLEKFKGMKESFDIVSVDYYPSLYHFPWKSLRGVRDEGDAFPIKPADDENFGERVKHELGNRFNRMFKDTELLKKVCEEIASWDMPYEIGETGFPTNEPYSSGKRQRLFYDMHVRALRQMIVDFAERGIALPKRVGFHEAQDEDNKFGGGAEENPIMKWVKKRKIYAEEHFGLIDKVGNKKEVLQEGTRSPEGLERSQLHALIDYLKRPL